MAHNVLTARVRCPSCGADGVFDVRFRYGSTRRHAYTIGDVLRWGEEDIGFSGARKVIVHGIGESCPHCHADAIPFEIWLFRDRIEGVTPAERRDGTQQTLGYTIVML